MKIITQDAVYVQYKDIAFLYENDLLILDTYNKVFGNNSACFVPHNNDKFMKFNTPATIKYFEGLDWIIDYNEVKDLEIEECIKLGQSITDEKNSIAKTFNSMSIEDQEKNIDMVTACQLLEHKIYSLRDIIWFKQGRIKIKLPEGVDLPDGYEPKKSITDLIRSRLKAKK